LTKYGIGYVWIMLIYLYSALLVPIIERIGFSVKAIVTVILFYLAYEILYHFQIGTNNIFIETTFYYIIPYGLLTYIGYNLEKIKRKKLIVYIAANLVFFIATAFYLYARTGSLQQVQAYKYPPRLYYLSYGIFCSLSLMTICKNKRYEKYFNNRIMQYISSHSMWIYLWHILTLSAYEKLHLPENWILKFLAVSISAILIVILVNKFLDKLEKRKHIKLFDYLRG
jgi:peptidoglycan/LPS O-acetylase OafA/YrhL